MTINLQYTPYSKMAPANMKAKQKGARFREIIIDYTTREKFLKIFDHFFAEKDISFVYGQFDTAKDEIYGKIRALRRPAVL